MVPPDSYRISGVPYYLGAHQRRHARTPTGLSPSTALLSNRLRFDTCFLTSPHDGSQCEDISHNPEHATPARYHTQFGLASSDFARHYSRNHYCFLFLPVLRCFTSPRSPLPPYFIQTEMTGHDSSQVSPFGHPRITARLPTPQGLSQAPTSFIGS